MNEPQLKAATEYLEGLEMDVKKYEFQIAIDDQKSKRDALQSAHQTRL